jgi:HK97 family phage portal protein
MTWLDRLTAVFRSKGATEGAYRPGPWLVDSGWLPHAWGQYWNYWQMGYDPLPFGRSAMVEACVAAYAQTVAMCPLYHWRELANGGRERITTSALSRINRAPNDYQSRSDFLMNIVRSLYLDGNGYALALRNDRFEISSLHPMNPRACRGYSVNGDTYYELGGNAVIDSRFAALELDRSMLRAVPARDVLHVKLDHVHDVLHGESPLLAAGMAVAASNAALAQQIAFFSNQSRPSGVLQSDLTMTAAQVAELRARWDEQVKGLSAGGTPILTHGLKWNAVGVSAKDTQLAEALKLSDAQIAQVYRIPLAIVGSEQQPMGSTEALMNFWLNGGLGFALDRVELAIDKLFGLPATTNEYSEFDVQTLLRAAFKDRIEAFARGTIAGIYAPNEARAEFSLPAAEHGDEPRVQQQVVPLSFATEPPQPPTPAEPVSAADDEDEADELDDDEKTALLAFRISKQMEQARCMIAT